MSQNNLTRQVPYDHASVVARLAAQLTANTAGSGSISGKFIAWTQLQVYGVTFGVTTPGTSTYTVAGTATSPATQISAIYITNTATNSVALSTTTIGPFTVGGTTTAGTNVAFGGSYGGGLGGIGGVAGGFQGPYALNTLGGTNTSLTWGTNTYIAAPGTATGSQVQVGYPGGGNVGIGGLPMNPGDQLYFVMGTDTTAGIVPVVQYGVQPVNGSIVA